MSVNGLKSWIDRHIWFQSFLVIASSLLVCSHFFITVFEDPGHVLFNASGDGIKNYFAPIWYVLNDTGAWFTGLNYPDGENVIYTDNMPILSFILSWVHNNLFALTPANVVATMNLVILANIVLGTYLLYLIFKKAGVSWGLAWIFALLVNYHAPQIARLNGGHFALAFVSFVPLLWLLIHGIVYERLKLLKFVLLTATILVFAFMHPYYLPLAVFFIAAYVGVLFVSKPTFAMRSWLPLLAVVSSGLLVYIFFSIWLKVTDPVSDRIVIPYGLDVFHGSWFSLFWPEYKPAPKEAYFTFEGIAYIGWFGAVALLLMVAKLLQYAFKGRFKRIIKIPAPDILQPAFWMSVILFPIATAWIFIQLNDWFPDSLVALKQFRSAGRFGWAIYYLFAVWSLWILYLIYRRLKMNGLGKLATTLMAIVLIFTGIEVYFYNIPYTYKLRSTKHRIISANYVAGDINYDALLDKHGYQSADFQAIFTVPFYHLGSDKIGRNPFNGFMLRESMKLATETGLPLMSAYLARTSVSQQAEHLLLLGDPLAAKSLSKKIQAAQKPILLIEHIHANKQEKEQMLIDSAALITEMGEAKLYSLPAGTWERAHQNAIASARADIDSGLCEKPILWNDFDDEPNTDGWEGSAAKVLESKEPLILDVEAAFAEDTMLLSFWVSIDSYRHGTPQITYKTVMNDGSEQTVIRNPANAYNTFGYWTLMEEQLLPGTKQIIIYSESKKQTVLDNLMLHYAEKPACQVLSASADTLYNGYLLR